MLISEGMSPARAAAWAANAEAESGSGRAMRQGRSGPGQGAFQWNPERRANFRRAFGHPYEQSTLREQLTFPQWEFDHDPYEREYSGPRVRKVEATSDPGLIADTISRYYLRPRERHRDADDRANLANFILRRAQTRGERR